MKRVQGSAGSAALSSRRDRRVADVVPLRNPARNFIVLTTQRTGSSWLMDRLNKLPGAEGHMELFYHEPRREPARAGRNDYPRFVESRDAEARGRRPFAVFRYLDGLYGRHAAAGFKLMYSQLREYPEILLYVMLRRLPIIHLVRNNHLDVLVSEELARVTGRSHDTAREAGGRREEVRVTLDPQAVVAGIRRLARKQRLMRVTLRLIPNSVHEIAYESLCDDPSRFDALCRFLKIDTSIGAHASNLVKRQRAPHEQAIENFAEVRRALERAGMERLLHQGNSNGEE